MGASEGPQAKDEMLLLCTSCGDGLAQPPAALHGVGTKNMKFNRAPIFQSFTTIKQEWFST